MTIKTHESDSIDAADIRREIYRQLRNGDGRDRDDLRTRTAESLDVTEARVTEQINEMERNGLIYIVNGEVRVP